MANDGLPRREVLLGGAGALSLLAAGCATAAPDAAGKPKQAVWTFDNLNSIGGFKPHVEGHPQIIDSPQGKAVLFNGVDDALFFDTHPLAGAPQFAFEAVFRPDGGAFEQRWFHLAEVDPKADPAVPPNATRFMFEIRVVETEWYLDAFVVGPGYKQTLIFPDKKFPVGQWHHVAQTYDGKTYRSFVNGQLQGEADIAFVPQGPGRSSAGVRINHVNYFKGAIAKVRFTPAYVAPDKFLKLA